MRIILALLLALIPATVQAEFSAALSWTDNSTNEDGFILERNLNGGAFAVLLVGGVGSNVVSYTDSTLAQPTAPSLDSVYCYRVLAFNSAGNSAYSNTACKTISALPPPVTIPKPPSGLTVAAISNQTIEASWGNNNAPQLPTELIRRSANGSDERIIELAAGKTSYRENGLPGRTTKCYRARAKGTALESGESCATTK